MPSVNVSSNFIKVILVIQVVILIIFLGAFIVLVKSIIATNMLFDNLTMSITTNSKNLDNLFNAISSEKASVESLLEFNRDVNYETKMIDCYELESQSNEWRVVATYAYGYGYYDPGFPRRYAEAKCIIERPIDLNQ